MLWTDRVFVTIDDMHRIDSEVQAVADAEGINLLGKTGLLYGGICEAALELQKMLVSFGGYMGSGDVSPNHTAAVANIGRGASVTQKAVLSQVVVSGEVEDSSEHVKQWATFWALQVFYRDAFNRTVKDRYEGKMRYYKSELQRRLTPAFFSLGLPVIISPLAAPGAVFERGAGDWNSENLSLVAGSGTADSVEYDVAITYVNMATASSYVDSDNRNNCESHPSERAAIGMLTGNVIRVSIASLDPPDGTQSPSQALLCVIKPTIATHWNVYVGKVGSKLYLQNTTPIPIATTVYDLAADPVFSGASSEIGQWPTQRLVLTQTRRRA